MISEKRLFYPRFGYLVLLTLVDKLFDYSNFRKIYITAKVNKTSSKYALKI